MLFNLYINDLNDELQDISIDPVTLNDTKINSLCYADDLVLISRTSSGLQNALNILQSYCSKWNLCINVSKTTIVIFKRRLSLKTGDKFYFQNQNISCVNSYMYLGVIIQANGKFCDARQSMADKALRALYVMLKQIPKETDCKTFIHLLT